MAPSNADLVRGSFAAFNARDLDALLAISDPDSEWVPFRAQLEGSSYRGHAGIRQFLADMDADWSEFTIEPSEVREEGARVVVIGRITGIGRGSGVEIDTVGGFVFQVHGGLITSVVSHSDPAIALAELDG